jgi:glycosyl transferase, family 25
MQDTPVLIINLDRSPDRLSFQRSQALRLGLRFERIPAADGVRLLQADFELYAYQWLRPLSRTEVGCLLSHAACWGRVVELKRNAIVLEDDVVGARGARPSFAAARTLRRRAQPLSRGRQGRLEIVAVRL